MDKYSFEKEVFLSSGRRAMSRHNFVNWLKWYVSTRLFLLIHIRHAVLVYAPAVFSPIIDQMSHFHYFDLWKNYFTHILNNYQEFKNTFWNHFYLFIHWFLIKILFNIMERFTQNQVFRLDIILIVSYERKSMIFYENNFKFTKIILLIMFFVIEFFSTVLS